MYLGDHARATPDKAALIMAGSGAVLTYRELDERSCRLAQLLHAHGLRRGDHIALFMENHPRFAEICWAGMRSGLYVTAVNRYLTPDEAAYIVNDCKAQALVTSLACAPVAQALGEKLPACPLRLMVDGTLPGWESYERAVSVHPAQPLEPEWLGDTMLYSSGTTGRPKGIKRPLPERSVAQGYRHMDTMRHYGFDPDTVYLSPAPLYHAAPLAYVLGTQFCGGTALVMEKFDAQEALRLIGQYRVTHSQWVPTMFVRMLKLPPGERAGYDLSSHRVAIHAAAPCAVAVKRQMIDWWGPILAEYYAGTEANGATRITSQEWLATPAPWAGRRWGCCTCAMPWARSSLPARRA